MFNFICKQCSRKCLSVGEPRCFHCIGQRDSGIVVNENLFQQQRHAVTSRDTDVVGGSGNNPTSNPSLNFKAEIQLNDPITMESGEVYGKSTQALSYESEDDFSPFSKGRTTRDRVPEKITTEIRLSHDNFLTENKNRELFQFNRNTTLDSSIPQITSSYYQTIYSEKESSGSCGEYNMKTTQNNPRLKGCTAHILTKHGEYVSSDARGCNNVIKSDAASLFSIDYSSITDKKHKLLSAISYTEAHKEMNSDDIAAVAGPSGLQESQQIRNSHSLMPYSDYVSEIPCVRVREQYRLTCKVCKMEVEEHLVTKGNEYRCCVCKFTTSKHVNLQMHSYTHCREKTCNTCGKQYREGNLHDSEHTCNICQMGFYCRTQYGEHLIGHPSYLNTYCWACNKHNSEHWIIKNKEQIFACCFCRYDGDKVRNFYLHISSHCHHPNFYCRICREEYCKAEEIFHDKIFPCSVCSNSFQCQTQLEEHTRRNHKYSHDQSGLRLFKCETCGKRFKLKDYFHRHSKYSMLFICEICGANFPTKTFLNEHQLEIHTHIQVQTKKYNPLF